MIAKSSLSLIKTTPTKRAENLGSAKPDLIVWIGTSVPQDKVKYSMGKLGKVMYE